MEGTAKPSCAAHAVVLQLPLEGVLAGGGITAVLKRPAGNHPEWLVGPHGRDFFISFAEVGFLQLCSRCRLETRTGPIFPGYYIEPRGTSSMITVAASEV
jgi:hypothetical protein